MLSGLLSRAVACADGRAGCQLTMADAWLLLALLLSAVLLSLAWNKALSALSTWRALALTPLVSRRLTSWVGARDYTEHDFFAADGALQPWVDTRRQALAQLADRLKARQPESSAWAASIRDSFSDLRFTDANRVPFPFARLMRETFNLASVATESRGPRLLDLDGNWSLDVGGSYGVNVAGFDRYKTWMADGLEKVKDLGPVLGPLHPLVADNIARLKSVSRLDDVSFHMSGTEAVMAAVRLARFNTRRKLIVTFSGAYHGWWDGVLPGIGNERTIDDCLTLKDVDLASLVMIRRRAHEIAGVLVNPVQSFHPNAPPPNDAVLVTSDARRTEGSTEAYGEWLRRLRDVCTASDVPLIFDEVYSGFRLAPGGAQDYFDVQADVVIYGKTVAGGMPVGVVCGTSGLMRRFDPERPLRLAYVVGTFSAHPVVMAAMNEFLQWATAPTTPALYEEMNARCETWVRDVNAQLVAADLPIRVMNLGTVWTTLFKQPGRYNWLLQYYLRAEGLALSWVGTGRCLTNMDYTEADYDSLRTAIVEAARQMRRDGWWLTEDQQPGRDARMRLQLLRELAGSLIRIPKPVTAFYAEVMRRKEDDHHASHTNKANQFLHLISSSAFIYCYAVLFTDLTTAMFLGVAALFVRQVGHAILEPPCHAEEETLLGYNTRNKTLIFLGYLLIPAAQFLRASSWSLEALQAIPPVIAQQWFVWTVVVVLTRVLYLVWKHSFRVSMIWYAKLVSDPVTDIITYFPRPMQRV